MINTEEEARAFTARHCDVLAMERLALLAEELEKEAPLQNLVAKNSLPQKWVRHIADSVQLAGFAEVGASPWIDLGSGAGFPGLVIAAIRPQQSVILVESRAKRIEWLERMADKMGLSNCKVEGRRLELVETFEAGVISARAFAPLDKLLRLSARFSTSDTRWVLPKGRSASQEVEALPQSQRGMFHVEQSLTDPLAGIIVGQGKWSAAR
ncbi:16S rRNA (guanine(527)-N(7))-methyltransferase RsmG [Qipengyuania zhejiangensis]|uniref:16S rRNA (guanine(527)-N(7))-methyltransferase RsmG n=1 Tax=Qipengyuania zhejiangensis TaxID=3077782 RepID=UPI002D76E35E|nr:16S rRNA (guanine(527)-N(7))-methyltransferase RsmG [Qipengyuania sp. Z2]